MYLNIASYLYGKQIKSKMGNKLYLQMIFISVRLNWLDIHECHTMPLKGFYNLQGLVYHTPNTFIRVFKC